jgi:hypothetical protein
VFSGVYAERPQHLSEQLEQCERGPRPRKGHG